MLLAAFTVRFYKVESIPAGLYHDEVDAGYQARSLIETGRDYRGDLSPFYVNSFVDPRTPVPVWITVISTLIFSSEELQVRMGSVIVGTLNVLLIFLLIKNWTKSFGKAFYTSLVFAVNPWQIQFSRFNHEANSILLFLLLTLIFFNLSIQKINLKYLILSVIFLGFSMYTYRSMSLFAPIVLFTLFIIFRKKLLLYGVKKLGLCLLVFLFITIPFLYQTTFAAKDKPRIAQISIFSDQKYAVQVQRDRELDSNDVQDFEFGKKPVIESFAFHNKAVSAISEFTKNYFSTFSVDFLFINGDKNKRHSVEGHGMLFYTDLIAIGFGLYQLFKLRKDGFNRLILALFFLSPVPSALTQDGAMHGARLFIFSLPLLIIIGTGYFRIIEFIRRFKFKWLLASPIFLIWLVLVTFYLHQYFVHSLYTSARWHSFGYKESLNRLKAENRTNDLVFLTASKDPPVIFYLFWMHVPPGEVRFYGSNFSPGNAKNLPLDRLKAAELPYNDIPALIKSLDRNAVYLVSQKELPLDLRHKKPPEGINLIQTITYPDKEVAFYLIGKSPEEPNPTHN